MSRLFSSHSVQVQPRKLVHLPSGNTYRPDGEPVQLTCDFRYVSSTETQQNGIAVDYVARLLVPGRWPYGTTAQIVADGQRFEIEGLPLVRDGSARTRHTQINLRWAGANG